MKDYENASLIESYPIAFLDTALGKVLLRARVVDVAGMTLCVKHDSRPTRKVLLERLAGACEKDTVYDYSLLSLDELVACREADVAEFTGCFHSKGGLAAVKADSVTLYDANDHARGSIILKRTKK